MTEHGRRLDDLCRSLENEVRVARDQIGDRFVMLRIRTATKHAHRRGGSLDLVATSLERHCKELELVTRYEEIDIDRRAQPTVMRARSSIVSSGWHTTPSELTPNTIPWHPPTKC
jgi:hypothetical protein